MSSTQTFIKTSSLILQRSEIQLVQQEQPYEWLWLLKAPQSTAAPAMSWHMWGTKEPGPTHGRLLGLSSTAMSQCRDTHRYAWVETQKTNYIKILKWHA